MNISKQLCIHRLCLSSSGAPLCDDVLNVIKSFCFYDKKTAETMNFIKKKKQEINQKFEHAYCSRFRPYRAYAGEKDPDHCEHWAICLDDDIEHGVENQFQQINCKKCGNYKHEWIGDTPMIETITCNCVHEQETEDQDEENEDMYDSSDDAPWSW
jgi:hypothetical protein